MSLLGKILLILSTLCFLFTFSVKLAFSGWMPFMGFGLGFAAVFFILALIVDFKFYKSLIRSESLHFVLQSLVFVIVTGVFLAAVNYGVAKYNKIFDLTDNKINSLTDFSVQTVDSIPSDFYFKYFYADSDQSKDYELMVQAAIQQYKERSPKIHFESYSVYKNPQEAKAFMVGESESALFASYQDRVQRISDLSEASITNAILKLIKEPKVVYFMQGHGERSLSDEGNFGLTNFKKEMERLHYDLKPLDKLPVPNDAAFLAIVGPRLSFTDSELQSIRDYVLSGGSLFVAIDPGESHHLAGLTKTFGIEFQNAFTFDSSTQAGQSDLLVFANASKSNHELANTVTEEARPLLFMASPLKVFASDFTKMNITPILSFSPTSVARQDMNPSSPIVGQGSQLAALITEAKLKDEKYFRVFVIGDSDFLTNQFFSQHANFDFSLNIMSFLSKDEDMIKMRPRRAKTTYLIVTQTQMNIYFLFFVVPFILLFFIAGIFLKLRRLF